MVDSNVGKRSFPDSFDGTFVKSFAPQEAEVRRTDRQKNVFWLCRNTCVGAYARYECLFNSWHSLREIRNHFVPALDL